MRLTGRAGVAGALLVHCALVVTAVWADLPGRLAPDTVPELYTAPARLLAQDLSSWLADPWLGSPNLQHGRAPVSALLAALSATGLPDWALVRLWRSLLLVVAALGAAALHRRWTGRATAGTVVMAVVYSANPYVVVGGSTTPTLLPYALLPWLVLFLSDAVERPGWRAPAGFGLVLFAMSGTQVGVVPLLQLLAVPAVVLDARVRRQVPWRTALGGVLRCGVVGLAVSLYWLLPGLAALAQGTQVAGATETDEVIAGPSSPAEVLRGLGMWTMYGRDATGPFQPGFLDYVTSPLVVLASFALPVAAAAGAALSRSRLRLLGVALVALAVPVMVGRHPFDDPTPFGRLVGTGFAEVPGLVALRTTNKAGGVLLLGTALLVALLADEVVRRVRAAHLRAAVAAVGAGAVVAASWPAVAGPLSPVVLDVPAYWHDAAAALDAAPDDGRVLVLPGAHVPRYRWGYTSPADLPQALLERGTVQRQVVPNGSPQAADLLAALDTALQEGRLPAGALSTVARMLGVQDLLLRHDLVWEDVAGARPADVAAAAAADPGLELVREFGRPGEHVGEPGLPPLQHYRVLGAPAQVRAQPVAGTVLVAGSHAAVPDLVGAGLLPAPAGHRLLAGMRPDDLAAALRDGARVVLTDTGRRRDTAGGRLTAATGPTLAADQPVERFLGPFRSPQDQTVAELDGASVTATQSGSLFGPVPQGGPALALDGDPATGWLAGDFGTAVGQRLDVRLDAPRPVPSVRLRALETAPRVAAVTVAAGDQRRRVDLPAGEDVVVELDGRPVDAVSVTVEELAGDGDAAAGLAEVVLEGVPLEPVLRLPRTLERLAAELDDDARQRLADAPLDVVLSRSRAVEGVAADDEEARLSRDFTTLGTHDVLVGGVLRAGPGVPEPALDQLAGYDPAVSVVSTSRFFDNPAVRGSAAFDGNPFTAWSPGGDGVGEAVTATFPARDVPSVVVRQAPDLPDGVAAISRVRVRLSDGRTAEADVGPGAREVPLPDGPPVTSVEVTVLERSAELPVLLEDVVVPGLVRLPDPARAATACVPVLGVSGAIVDVRPDLAALEAGRPSPFAACGGPVRLAPGEQAVRTAPGWLVDRVHLRDVRPAPEPSAAPPEVTGADDRRLSVAASPEPFLLVLGQGYDERWSATARGEDLGPPVAADGWSTAWRIEAGDAAQVEVAWGPERLAVAGRAVSGAALLASAVLLLRRRDRPATPVREPVRRAPGRARTVAAWGAAVAALWLVGGALLGGAGVLLAVLAQRPRVRAVLPWAGVALLAAVPVARLLDGLPDAATVSADAVVGGAAEHLAALGLAVLVVGVGVQERRRA